MKRLINDKKREEKLRNLKKDNRDYNGRFLKGRPSPYKKSFSKDYNVHKPQIYWEKEWLIKEYIDKNRSAKNIAKEFEVSKETIKHWLRKYRIYKKHGKHSSNK